MDDLIWEIPTNENNFLGGDLHGHVGKDSEGYEKVHVRQVLGKRNEIGETILDFALSFDLVIQTPSLKRQKSI